MNVCKLRIETDENPGFVLDIEIRDDQTFLDLHEYLVKSMKLSGEELASFYVADENWEKYEEITLIDMSGEEDEKHDDEDDLHTIFLMSSTKIGKFISDINQYLIYEYDFLQLHTFMIECIDIKPADKRVNYPRVANETGNLKMVNKVLVEKDPEKLRESLLKDFNSLVKGDVDYDDDDDTGEDDY